MSRPGDPAAIFRCSVCGYECECSELGFKNPEVARGATYAHQLPNGMLCLRRERSDPRFRASDMMVMEFVRLV